MTKINQIVYILTFALDVLIKLNMKGKNKYIATSYGRDHKAGGVDSPISWIKKIFLKKIFKLKSPGSKSLSFNKAIKETTNITNG